MTQTLLERDGHVVAGPRARTPEVPPSAYPNKREAAAMLGVDPASLTRRHDLEIEPMGREQRVRARSVMRLAAYYRKRSLVDVGADLMEYVREHEPEHADAVDHEIEEVVEERRRGKAGEATPRGETDFLATAKRILPPSLYAEVKRAYDAGGGQHPADMVSGSDL